MKKMKVYSVYLDDSNNTIRVDVPAPSKREAVAYCAGNGEVVAVKDCCLQNIDLECLASTLKDGGWGQMEIDVITRCLTMCGLDRV